MTRVFPIATRTDPLALRGNAEFEGNRPNLIGRAAVDRCIRRIQVVGESQITADDRHIMRSRYQRDLRSGALDASSVWANGVLQSLRAREIFIFSQKNRFSRLTVFFRRLLY